MKPERMRLKFPFLLDFLSVLVYIDTDQSARLFLQLGLIVKNRRVSAYIIWVILRLK